MEAPISFIRYLLYPFRLSPDTLEIDDVHATCLAKHITRETNLKNQRENPRWTTSLTSHIMKWFKKRQELMWWVKAGA